MDIDVIRSCLGWCTIINFGVLLYWFAAIAAAGDWVYRFHGRWFPMSRDTFRAVHYCGMGLFKLAIIVFNLVPYLALRIVG